MMKNQKHSRAWWLTAILVVLMVLAASTLAQAENSAPEITRSTDTESEREAVAAAALEADPGLAPGAAATIVASTAVSAPLFAGVDNVAEFAYLIDPDTGDSQPLFDGLEVWGAAYDRDHTRVLLVTGTKLYEWPIEGVPVLLGDIKSAAVADSFLAMVGLAYGNGALYGIRNISTAADPEGLYIIDPDTLYATLVTTYTVGSASVDLGGLDFDPVTGKLYATNDTSGLEGLVEIGLDGQITVVAPYPIGQTDLDGLAIGDGRAYLIPDGPGSIYIFDFATMTYLPPIPNPWIATQTFSGGAWIEEPTCYTLIRTHTGNGSNPAASPASSTNCAAGQYTAGEPITLTATPADDWRVKNWSGTNNNASTATINTATMPAANHTVSVTYEAIPAPTHWLFAPAIFDIPYQPPPCFPGPFEQEDNDIPPMANGPLCGPGTFSGFPNDLLDYFSFDTAAPGPIAVTVTGHQGQGVQLQLYYNSVSDEPVAIDPGQADGLSVGLPVGGPGRYYILIYTETLKPGATQPYEMTVAFP